MHLLWTILLRYDSVGFNLVASQSSELPKPRSLVHIQLFQLHRIIVLRGSYQKVLSIALGLNLGKYKFGASTERPNAKEGKVQKGPYWSPWN